MFRVSFRMKRATAASIAATKEAPAPRLGLAAASKALQSRHRSSPDEDPAHGRCDGGDIVG